MIPMPHRQTMRLLGRTRRSDPICYGGTMRALILAASLLAPSPVAAQLSSALSADVSVCFTPPSGCGAIVVGLIDQAKATIQVQAYFFTAAPIVHALAEAHRCGVDVRVILDKVNDRDGYSGASYLAHAGVPVWIDRTPAIAHNKVMVLDGDTVIGGSFNFTKTADTRNAENVTVIRSASVAAKFAANWESRRAASMAYHAE